MNFIEALKNETDNEKVLSENGAVMYRTSGNELLDFNFKVSSMRSWTDEEIKDEITTLCNESAETVFRYFFYLRDREQGIGERRTFRLFLKSISVDRETTKKIIKFVPMFGRWDDLWCLLDTDCADDVLDLVVYQLGEDMENCKNKKPISLMAKWLPSANTSSAETRRLAKIIYKSIGVSEKDYRKLLSKLRKYIDVTEVKTSANRWGEIDYNKVPSKANVLYKEAFMRHDAERRSQYLRDLCAGKDGVKINASVLFPHDVVHKYDLNKIDVTCEQLWNNLPDFVNGNSNTLVIRDGSGSMTWSPVGGVFPIDIATALTVYFAEKCTGQFHNTFITFASDPKIVNMNGCKSLYEKLKLCRKHADCTNTDIEKTFDLILDAAVRNNMKQEELPANLLIVSDMEFDMGVRCADKVLFESIADRFAEHGYKLPRLVFWNVCSRTTGIPIKKNEAGVCLVSGFSAAICKMVLNGELDAYNALMKEVNSERYDCIAQAIG